MECQYVGECIGEIDDAVRRTRLQVHGVQRRVGEITLEPEHDQLYVREVGDAIVIGVAPDPGG